MISEHFSIWNLINNEPMHKIEKIILTASGGPFLNTSVKKIKNINPKYALSHPNWKMGKKISIDSSNMMNKVFEYIEAKKIFNLDRKELDILVHPSSYVHAIVYFKGGIIKLLAHEAKMTIPISSALGVDDFSSKNSFDLSLKKLNSMKFLVPNKFKFPLLSLIDQLPTNTSYFETILITLNDSLVKKYLDKKINYISIQQNLLRLIKKPFFRKYYKLKPKSIYDIKKMISITKSYLNTNINYYND
jgi:1-deoxy-D-xylulose 5-phosphate reductoisomerase